MGKQMTIQEAYAPAMQITEQHEADKYFEFLVGYCMGGRPLMTREEAERIERNNLGYYAGYYDHDTRARVERLFRCQHPYFGKIAEKGPPTPLEAFEAGVQLARKACDRTYP